MHSAEMSIDPMRRQGAKIRLSQLRKLRECEQVAAVCYRVRNEDIEFLLVQTGGGRWTFPKGGVEPGLTHAQSAAFEAFEEAGVHGRMEEAWFARYIHRDRSARGSTSISKSNQKSASVLAYLCEVTRLAAPQEADRNRTWCSAEKAKRRLSEDRTPKCGSEFARVVDRAVARIRRLQTAAAQRSAATHEGQHDGNFPQKYDALRKAPFEASEIFNHYPAGKPRGSFSSRRPKPRQLAGVVDIDNP